MDGSEENKDWDKERKDIETRFVHNTAKDYLKSVNKITYDRQPANTNARRIANAVLGFADDRYVGDTDFEHDDRTRTEIVNVVEEIVKLGIATDPKTIYGAILNPTTTEPVEEEKVVSFGALDKAVNNVMNAATRWGEREEFTPMERCHGLAHELYQDFGTRTVASSEGDIMNVDPGNVYANAYERRFADQIKARSIKAAKELFGK